MIYSSSASEHTYGQTFQPPCHPLQMALLHALVAPDVPPRLPPSPPPHLLDTLGPSPPSTAMHLASNATSPPLWTPSPSFVLTRPQPTGECLAPPQESLSLSAPSNPTLVQMLQLMTTSLCRTKKTSLRRYRPPPYPRKRASAGTVSGRSAHPLPSSSMGDALE